MTLWNVLRPAVWTTFRMVSRTSLALRSTDYRYLFILGHVRSGSTLLSHILAAHPDIVGAGETHIRYESAADLPKLALMTSELLHRPILRQNYIVDQINHSYVSDDVLLSERLYRSLILIRQPEDTLKSMVSLSVWGEQQALQLYMERLATLCRYGKLLKHRAFLVEYDDLVDNSETSLGNISHFLELRHPLEENYVTHRMTGRIPGYGDPSQNIKRGRIVRTSSHDVTISQKTLITANDAFAKTRAELLAVTRPTSASRV